MTKNNKINLALTIWATLTALTTKGAYDLGLSFNGELTDGYAMALLPAIVTLALALTLTIRLTK